MCFLGLWLENSSGRQTSISHCLKATFSNKKESCTWWTARYSFHGKLIQLRCIKRFLWISSKTHSEICFIGPIGNRCSFPARKRIFKENYSVGPSSNVASLLNITDFMLYTPSCGKALQISNSFFFSSHFPGLVFLYLYVLTSLTVPCTFCVKCLGIQYYMQSGKTFRLWRV